MKTRTSRSIAAFALKGFARRRVATDVTSTRSTSSLQCHDARFSSSARYAIGEFYDGYKRNYSWGPTFRPNEKLNASLNVQLNDITLPTVSYLSTLMTTRVNYNFNTRVFLNALLQYSTDSHQLSSNIRFSPSTAAQATFFLSTTNPRRAHSLCRNVRSSRRVTYMVAFLENPKSTIPNPKTQDGIRTRRTFGFLVWDLDLGFGYKAPEVQATDVPPHYYAVPELRGPEHRDAE